MQFLRRSLRQMPLPLPRSQVPRQLHPPQLQRQQTLRRRRQQQPLLKRQHHPPRQRVRRQRVSPPARARQQLRRPQLQPRNTLLAINRVPTNTIRDAVCFCERIRVSWEKFPPGLFSFMEIRNIAIIAHVDHGKTTITDALLRQTGVAEEGVSMDSNAIELERGITIYSKNASIPYKGTKINLVDTPGHADFGSEVERVLRAIDSVLLVVDAQEGPMPQTRFVLKKSLELGLKPIVVINKIDKPAADPSRSEEQVLELFFDLGASDQQATFPVVYAIGREGIAKRKLEDESKDLSPLLDVVLEHVPSASCEEL